MRARAFHGQNWGRRSTAPLGCTRSALSSAATTCSRAGSQPRQARATAAANSPPVSATAVAKRASRLAGPEAGISSFQDGLSAPTRADRCVWLS